jgi:UTP:GlnB (protein PII) uridylyltransferase
VARREPSVLARQASLLAEELPARGVRAHITSATSANEWWIDVAARDRRGLLAMVTEVLCARGLDVIEAVVATWPDRMALESFLVRADVAPDATDLERELVAALDLGVTSEPLAGAEVSFDNEASPWHTVCEVITPDQPGVLHVVASAFAAAGVDVIAATIVVHDGLADDRFEVVDRRGNKLGEETADLVRRYLEHGVRSKRRMLGGRRFDTAVPV